MTDRTLSAAELDAIEQDTKLLLQRAREWPVLHAGMFPSRRMEVWPNRRLHAELHGQEHHRRL